MKNFKWSVNKIISFLLLSSCVLVGLIAGVFSFKNANVSMQNGTSIERAENNLNANPLSNDELFLATSQKRTLKVYHYSGEWSVISSDINTFAKTVVYFKEVPAKGQDIASELKDFYVLDCYGNAVDGMFKAGQTSNTSGTNVLEINFIPKNTNAYDEISFTVAYSCLYNELYFYENAFYADNNHTINVTLGNDANSLTSGGTIYIVKGTWQITNNYNREFTIKPYAGFTGTLIKINGSDVKLSNITIDGQDSNITLIEVASSKKLTLTNATIQNNKGVAINNSGTLVLDAVTKVKNISATLDSPIKLNSGSTLTIQNSSELTNLSGTNGGAIYATGATLNIYNSIISNCSATEKGGAIYFANNNDTGKFIINDSTIENCRAQEAGAIYLDNARMHLTSNNKKTSIVNNITTLTADTFADIEVKNSSIVYLSGKLEIQSSIGILVQSNAWGTTSPIQLENYVDRGTLLSDTSIINVKIINNENTLLNKSALVSCSSWVSGYSSYIAGINSVLEKVVNLVNKSVTYKLRTTEDFAGIRLGWLDSNSTIYFDPSNNSGLSSDANYGDSSSTPVTTWNKVLRLTKGNIIVKLLSTWNISDDKIDNAVITELNGEIDKDKDGYTKKIAKIVRQNFTGNMLNVTKSLTLKNIVLDGGNLSSSCGAILFSSSAIDVTIQAGTEFINNYLNSSSLAGSAININNEGATLTINSGTYFNNTASGTKNFEIFAVAKHIKVDGLNLNKTGNYGAAYLDSRTSPSTSDYIQNSLFANSTGVALVAGNVNVTNVSISNSSGFGLVVANKVNVIKSQISNTATAFSSLDTSFVNLDITSTTLQNNTRLVAGNNFNASDPSYLNITLKQDLTINGATSRQIHTEGSLSLGVSGEGKNLTITGCSSTSTSKNFAVICAGNMNLYGITNVYDNSTRPLFSTGAVDVQTGSFFNNTHSLENGGGAIYADKEIKLTNCSFYNNTVKGVNANGGAICSANSYVDITNCNFYSNTASGSSTNGGNGGAIYASGTVTIKSSSKFYNNKSTTGNGGVIFANKVIVSSTAEFKYNSTTSSSKGDGGAIYTSSIELNNAIIQHNKASGNGGAIYINYHESEMKFSPSEKRTYSYNTSSKNGGFVYCSSSAGNVSVVIENNKVEIINNTANGGNGGAIYTDGALTIKGGTFTNNYASISGGFAYTEGKVTISSSSSSFTYNTASGGNGGAICTSNAIEISIASEFNNNYAKTSGGAVYVTGAVDINTQVSKFENNSAMGTGTNDGGGAIYTSGTVAVSSASQFKNNYAQTNGGAICTVNATISDADNTTSHSVCINNYSASTYAYFYKNTAMGSSTTNGGGAIYTKGSAYLKGKFEQNYAEQNGGAVYCTTHVRTNSGSFESNTAKKGDGGVIFLASSSSSNIYLMGGGSFISNYAGSDGGVLYAGSLASAQIQSSFSYNKAAGIEAGDSDGYGGVLSLSGSTTSTVSISGSYTIQYNQAVRGGVLYTNGEVSLSSATFQYNLATTAGGVCYGGSKFSISSGTYDGNSCSGGQGGVIYSTTSQGNTTVDGGTFKNNYSLNSGSVFYLPNETVKFTITDIQDNNSIGNNDNDKANVLIKKTIISGTGVNIKSSLGVTATSSRDSAPIEFDDNYTSSGQLLIKVLSGGTAGNYVIKGYYTDSYYARRYESTNTLTLSGGMSIDGWKSTYSKKLIEYWVGTNDSTSGNLSSGVSATSNNKVIGGFETRSYWTTEEDVDKTLWSTAKKYYYYRNVGLKLATGTGATDPNNTSNAAKSVGNETSYGSGVDSIEAGDSSSADSYSESQVFKMELTANTTINSSSLNNSYIVLKGFQVTVTGNNANNIIFDGSEGGTIIASDGAKLTNCQFVNFTNNRVGFITKNGTLTLTDCVFKGNTDSVIIQSTNSNNLIINGNTSIYLTSGNKLILNQSSEAFGGIVKLENGSIIIENGANIDCSNFEMTGGTLNISGNAISARVTISGGNIISNSATINGDAVIGGTVDINVSGGTLTANNFTLSGKIISTAQLVVTTGGSISIGSIDSGSIISIKASSNDAGTGIATFTETVPTGWENIVKAYYNNSLLPLEIDNKTVKIKEIVEQEVEANIYYFDPNSANTYGSSDRAFFEALGTDVKYCTNVSELPNSASGKIVYIVSTWTNPNTSAISSSVTLTRWPGFSGVMVQVSSNTTIKNIIFNDNGVNGADSVISVASGTLTLENVTICNRNSTTSAINASSASSVTINGGKYYNNIITGDGETTGNGAVLTAKNINVDADAIFSNNSAVNGGAIYINSGTTRTIMGKFSNNHASGDGGAIYVKGNSLSLQGAKFAANYAVGNGGAIYLNGTTLSVNKNGSIDCEFKNNSATNGGAIYSGSDIAITAGTFTGNTATTVEGVDESGKGGVIYSTAGNITIVDGTFDENVATKTGGVIYSKTSGTITITKGDFCYNTSVSGAFAYVENSTLKINGGDIHNNLASGNGGVIYSYHSNLTLGACKINNNTNNASASLGTLFGGIIYYGYWNGSFSFSENCEISDNKINSTNPNISGGIIYLDCFSTATFNGTVKNNIVNAPKYCTGLAVFSGNEITLSKCNIINNKIGVPKGSTDTTNTESIIHCSEKLTISNSKIYGNETDSYIIYAVGDLIIDYGTEITKNTTRYKAIIKSNLNLSISSSKIMANQAKIILDTVELSIQSSSISGNILEGAESSIINSFSGFTITNSEISGNNLNDGTLYLVDDSKTVTFVNNDGKEIYGNLTTSQAVIINNNHKLEIIGYKIQYNINSNEDGEGGAVYLGSDAKDDTKLENVTFADNWATKGGSLFIAQNAQAFKLNIVSAYDYTNTIYMNGAVYIAKGIEFDLLAGSVFEGNYAINGVIYNLGLLTIKGPEFGENGVTTFSKNKVLNGVIYNAGNLTIENAVFNENDASVFGGDGGAIYNENKAQVLLCYSEFIKNKAVNGGAIYNNGIFNITNAKINGSTATEKGGFIYNIGNLSISTCQSVEGNLISAKDGGFVYNAKDDAKEGTFVINGGIFSNAYASENGGFIFNAGTFVMNKGELSNNIANEKGGAIYNTGNITINYGEFVSNKAATGSSIYINGGRLNIFDGVVSNHGISSTSGDAIYAENGSVVNIKNAEFKNNTTTNGAIVLINSELYAIDTSFIENKVGGAINASNKSTVVIKRVVFTLNTATNGGAINLNNSSLSVQDSRFNSNTSTENGGAIYASNTSKAYQVNIEEVEFTSNRSNNGGAVYLQNCYGEILDSNFIENLAIKGSAMYFAQGSSFVVDGGVVDGKGVSTSGQGAIYILSTAEEVQLGNITIQNNITTNKIGLYISNEGTNTALITLFANVNFVNNNLYYMGGNLHIKASAMINFDDYSCLYLGDNANRFILEPGLKKGSNIVVKFNSGMNNFIGSYNEFDNTKVYITSNDVKYISYLDGTNDEYVGYLSIDVNNKNRNIINFRQINSSILDVVVSSKVITIDGAEHRLDKNDFNVYYRGKDNLLNKNDYYIFYSKNAIDLIDMPVIDEENNISYGENFSSVLNKNGIDKTEYRNAIIPLLEELLGVSQTCPGYRETGINTIYYLVVYLYEHDSVVDSRCFTGSTSLSIVERNLTLEDKPMVTLYQVADKILLNNATFAGGLVTSDGYAVSGSWVITNNDGQVYPNDGQYNQNEQYYAKFIPYANNLFGTQFVLCKVDIQVNYSNLYYWIDSNGNDYFALSDGMDKEEINITLQQAVDMIQNNGNIYFLNTYDKPLEETTLNINKTINFISKEAPVFNILKGQTLSINVGIGGLYFYNYQNKCEYIINNAGSLTLGAGVNICKQTKNAIINSGTLSLNGCQIYSNINSSFDSSLIKNNKGTVFVNGGEFFSNIGENGSLIYSNGGYVYVNGGEIYGNTATNGGAIYMNGGTLILNGGKIRHNTAENGSAVYAKNSCSVNQNGTEIILNKSTDGRPVVIEPSDELQPAVYIINNKVVTAEQLMTSAKIGNLSTMQKTQESEKVKVLSVIIMALIYVVLSIVGLEITKMLFYKDKNKVLKK